MTYQGWRSINAPVPINLSRCPAYMKASLFVRDTPARYGKSSNGWRRPAPREFHPRMVLMRLLSLPATASRWKTLSRSDCD